MANGVYDSIPPAIAEIVAKQPMFFVATCPLSPEGHLNLSPKGSDSFRMLSANRVAYLDITGSGNETAAHLAENGRITFMFCTFEGEPAIIRLYGRGHVATRDSEEFAELRPLFPEHPGVRQIIVADLTRVQQSCGFGVPLLDFVGQRDRMRRWAAGVGEERLIEYRQRKNARSIDGLPAPLATE